MRMGEEGTWLKFVSASSNLPMFICKSARARKEFRFFLLGELFVPIQFSVKPPTPYTFLPAAILFCLLYPAIAHLIIIEGTVRHSGQHINIPHLPVKHRSKRITACTSEIRQCFFFLALQGLFALEIDSGKFFPISDNHEKEQGCLYPFRPA